MDSNLAAIQVSGELDLATVGMLEAKIDQALTGGSAQLLIDFTECGFIDSSVIAVLVGLRRGRLGDSVPPASRLSPKTSPSASCVLPSWIARCWSSPACERP